MKKKVLIVGSKGKMGSAVCEVLKNDYDIICVKERENWAKFSADLIIDFGSAESSVLSAEMSFKMGVPLIIGSTGQSKKQLEEIDKLCADVPFMVCANFSVGVVLLKSAIDNILKVKIDEIAIFEKHHREKKDTPSGTAKELLKYILKSQEKEVQMLSLRGGKEIGSHSVSFYFGDELVEVSHTAFSRKAFADGVALAVQFILNQKEAKKYDFESVVKEKFGLE